MNPTTQQVIEFLGQPELPFGAEEDILLLSDPQALQAQVAFWLDEKPAILGRENSESLKERLGQADWPRVAQEFQARVALADNFFDAHSKSD